MRVRRRSSCLVIFVAILMLCRPSSAQQPRLDVVQVTVEDELGGVLVGAKVTVVAVATQQTYEGVSDESGRVRFDKLQAGEYTVIATSPGFKTLERPLTVGTDRPQPLKLQLQIDVTERVEVSQRKRPLPQREKVEDNADAVCISRVAVSPQDAEIGPGRRAVPVLPGPGRSLVGSQPVEQCGLDSTDAMHHRHF